MKITVRRAVPEDSHALTRLSFAAKGYWNYPQEYLNIWKDELTISAEYTEKNIVYAAEACSVLAGFYSIIHNKEDIVLGGSTISSGFWLDHLFILPRFIGKGLGTALIRHAKAVCGDIGCTRLNIFADPNSRGFYLKMGAVYIGEYPSSIPGRNIPVFTLLI